MKTIADIRRRNLDVLAQQHGSVEAVATMAETSPVYLSQIKNQSVDIKTGKRRQMGTVLARKLEAGCGMPVGWMDTDHESPPPASQAPTSAPVPLTRNDRWPFEVAQERLQVLHDCDWIHLNSTIKAIVEVRERDNLARKSANSRS